MTYRSASRKWRRTTPPHRQVLLALLVFAMFSFFKVWQKTNIDYQYRRNDRLQAELKMLQGENALLQGKIDSLRTEERLTPIATDRLHLILVPKIILQEKNTFEKLTEKLDKMQ
ncbi:hypothetical protein JXO59_11725 [candidate division KSB1 bacterium]|nr:hypothetical protein [candidate division KSB1 bacterium]